MQLLLIRHGEIPSNVKKMYAGRSPERLTERGICQAQAVAEKLISCEVYALYSSPIHRALQTAGVIGKTIGMNNIVMKEFREMELGPWEGLLETEVARIYPDEWQIWQRSPADLRLQGRETLDELLERALNGIRDIYMNAVNDNVVVVTHVAVIRVLLLWDAKKSLNLYKTINVPNAKVFKIKIDSLVNN